MMSYIDAWRARRIAGLKPVRDDVLRALHAQYPFWLSAADLFLVLNRYSRRRVRRALAVLERDGFIVHGARRGAHRKMISLTRSGLAFPPERGR